MSVYDSYDEVILIIKKSIVLNILIVKSNSRALMVRTSVLLKCLMLLILIYFRTYFSLQAIINV